MPNIRMSKVKFPNDDNIYDVIDSNAFVDANQSDGQYVFTKEDGTTISVDSNPVTRTVTGNPISFNDGSDAPLVSCVSQIVSVQDLHGYDKPWVGGAGKNKLDGSTIQFYGEQESVLTKNGVTLTRNSDGSFKLSGTASADTRLMFVNTDTFKSGNSYTFSTKGFTSAGNIRIIISGVNPSTSGLSYTSVYPTDDWSKTFNMAQDDTLYYYYIDVQNGATVNVTLYAQIELGSTATTFSPYSNICPISGYDEVEIEGCGKNLFDVSSYPFTDGIYIYAINGTEVITTGFSAVLGFIPCEHLAGKTVTLNHRPSGYNPGFAFYSDAVDTSYISGIPNSGGSVGTSWTITIPTDAKYMRFTVPTDNKNDIQIELGSTATTYEPYTPNSYTISLGSTRYGGELDVSRGVLTLTYGYVDFDDLTWTKDGNNYRAPVTGIKRPASAGIKGNGICSHYPIAPQASPTANTISFLGWMDGIIFWGDGTYETVEDFIAAISGVQLVYELSTPLTISLTPTQVRSLLGNNYLSCNSGDLAIEYITESYQPLVDLIEDAVELPAVTSLDDGKVLTVVDGKWVAASLPVGQNIQY